ncbi:MAG TPA: ArsR family transcriptional regulator [Acidimicrobiia bacterium]|nr:ArsR family transcriptional regulator [Acidimicrobiia bacterium]
MPELIIPSERVRGLTEAPRRIPIEIEGSVGFEIPLTIWSAFSPEDPNTASELGEKWLADIRNSCGDELASELETLGGPWAQVWLAVSSLLLAAPHPHEPTQVFEWLKSVGEQRLRRWILGYSSNNDDQALIEQAAQGDVESVSELMADVEEHKAEAIDYLRWMVGTEGLPERFASALAQFRSDVFVEFEEEFAGAIARAAAARRAAPTRGSAKEVVEEVTSGIDFEIPLGITRIILVPSVLTRPLSLIDVYRSTLVVYYGIADEFIDSDPEAPPSWLVRTYKALSDERRLRILRRLSEGPASLDDLTEMLGLTKSTVHHHITLLRGAGLIRVHLSEKKSREKSFSLREQTLTDATGYLDSYLMPSESEEQRDVR